MTMAGPIETKVTAATIGAAVSGLGLWALQTYVFKGELPLPVTAAVQTIVPAIVAFIAGWLAQHTPRPDLQARRDTLSEPVQYDDTPGEHALDGDEGEIPVSRLTPPPAPQPKTSRYRHPQQ
jgi:hypothetical protein